MKLNILLFSLIVLPLFIQCNSITKHKYRHALQSKSSEQTVATTDTIDSGPVAENSTNADAKKDGRRNPFGILVDRTANAGVPLDKKIQVAKALGLNYMRLRTDIDTYNGTINNYDAFAAAGFKIILNINYSVPRSATGEKQPVPFPTDLDAYSKTFTSILDKYKPELVVVENEEDNPFYHSGTADDYINELKTAISICHAKGLKVTNGGLTVREITLLAFDDLYQNGKKQEAYDFARRVFPPQYLSRLDKIDNYQKLPAVRRALTFGRAVVAAYKTLDLDYVNFHWYEPVAARGKKDGDALNADRVDPAVFSAIVNYLSRKTGKPVITNEFGVLNTSPTLIQDLMQQVLNAKMDYAIFYSGDGAGGSKALQNGDGSLRQIGEAVRDFIKKNCE
jgi:hypothetical protein